MDAIDRIILAMFFWMANPDRIGAENPRYTTLDGLREQIADFREEQGWLYYYEAIGRDPFTRMVRVIVSRGDL